MDHASDFDTRVRLAVYRHFADTARWPEVSKVARAVESSPADVAAAYGRLFKNRALTFYADRPSASGGTGYSMGRSGPTENGVLSGGNNPYGVRAAIDPSNLAGVHGGCGPASGTDFTPQVSNQVLGPVPPGTCSLGAPAGVDFSAIPREQNFIIDVSVPVRQESMGFVKRLYAR